VLPQAHIKQIFGEFALRRTRDGFVQDPQWANRHLVVAEVPLLGRFRCHRRLFDALAPALEEVVRRGLASTVQPGQFAGCYSARAVRGATSLSRHAWGAAVDLNVGSNPLGAVPTIDQRLVAVLEDSGLRWGGRFLRPDGQHDRQRTSVRRPSRPRSGTSWTASGRTGAVKLGHPVPESYFADDAKSPAPHPAQR
jgi:hypothetical protein